MEERVDLLGAILTPDKKYRRCLVSLLQRVQAELGYLPLPAMLEVARFLEIPPAAVYAVATFYDGFRLTPAGRKPVKVCMGTACHLAGGQLVLDALERELDIKVGGMTLDNEYSLERVACIGCCAVAPVMLLKREVISHLTPNRVEEVLLNEKSKGGATPK